MPDLPDLPSRYEPRGRLGEGGMGVVWRVFDRERGEEVALKAFNGQGDEGRILFKQEFWAMAALPHPNLVAAYDYGGDYFTMEIVPGEDLAVPQDEAAVRAWLPGIAAALGFLHGRGYLHGDLKPENLRLGEVPKLMDLGLLERAGRVGGQIRGSLQYLAPEAIRQGALDARTDLYGLGAVLYHVLAGRPPFEEATTVGLLKAHLERKPAPLKGVSPELAAAVARLLAKDPRERFASAAELLAALGLAAHEEARGLLGSPLVGRDAVLADVEALLAAGRPARVHLPGEPGSGKTRVLASLKAQAQLEGLPAPLAGGLGADAAPYQAVLPWLRALTAVPTPALEHLAPVLARVVPELGVAPAPALEGPQERARLLGAVAELAQAALPGRTLWLLDDEARLDAASRELVAALARVEAPWVFVLAGGQPADGERALPLGPLSETDQALLAANLLGEAAPAAVLERLPFLAGGLPGPIEALLAHWVAAGVLVHSSGRWEAAPGASFELPGGLAVLGDARFTALSAPAQRVGRVAALLGPTGELGAALALAGLDEGRFFAAMAELEGADVLQREGERYRFVRPLQAEALAAGLDADDARRLHGSAARWLAARATAEPPLDVAMAIARHHLAGDAPTDGVAWALPAARRALALHAVPQAEALVTAALPHADAGRRLELLALMGYVLRFKGELEPALALYEEELLPALAGPALVEHTVTYGALLQMKGRYPDAMAAFTRAINLADEAGAPLQAIRARLFAGRVAVFAGDTKLARTPLAAAIRRARPLAADSPEAENLLARALGFFGMLEATTRAGAEAEGLAMLDEAIAIDTRLGDLRELHEAYNNQGNVYMALGRAKEAAEVFARCLALCGRMGTANEAIFAHVNTAGALLELGQVGRGLEHAVTAARLARQQGRKFPEGYALALTGLAELLRGEPGLGLAHLEEGLGLAREIANKYLELNILAHQAQALLLAGRWEAAGEALAAAEGLAAATENTELEPKLTRLSLALAVLTDAPDAGERLAAAAEATRAARRPAALAHVLAWQVQYRLGRGEHTEAERALAEAMGQAQQLGLARLLAELHLLAGRLAEAGHRRDQAQTHFRAALDASKANGDALTEALAAAGLGRAARDPAMQREGARLLAKMRDTLSPEDAEAFTRDPERRAALAPFAAGEGDGVSLARLRHLTGLIALLAGKQELFEVMQQALGALVELVEAERGFVVLYDGFEVQERLATGGADDDFSTGVAEQVLWTGQPLFVEDAGAHAELASRASVQALALRAVVGLPLVVEGQVIGVMIADSRRIKAGWGEPEMEVAQALAQAVAMAIAHARHADADAGAIARLEAVQRVALATAGSQDPAVLQAALAGEGSRLVGAERTLLLLGTKAGALVGLDGALPGEVSQSVCSWVLEQREPLYLVDVGSDEAFAGAASVMALGLRTIYAVPLAGRGVLYLDSQRMGEGSPHALGTLAALGELAGAYIARM